MKAVPPSSWNSQSQQQVPSPSPDLHQSNTTHQVPLSHPLSLAPPSTHLHISPSHPHPSSFIQNHSLKVFFNRKLTRAPSANSLHSSYSAASTTPSTAFTDHSHHPYADMSPAPLPVVSSRVAEEEDECPVCLEPLSFSFRLPGEKPHIVPECGHALHEACFSAVYGPPPSQARSTVPRKSNLGVCGVCRRPMKVGDGDGGKSNKLAALTGMGDRNSPHLYPGRDTPSSLPSYRMRSKSNTSRPFDPTEDDAVEHPPSVRLANHGVPQEHATYIVAPSIQVRPEFPTLVRNSEVSQPLTCIVTIELPGKRGSSPVPGQVMAPDPYASTRNGHVRHDTNVSGQTTHTSVTNRSGYVSPGPMSPGNASPRVDQQKPRFFEDAAIRRAPQSSGHEHRSAPGSIHEQQTEEERHGWQPSSASGSLVSGDEDSPFTAITEDLRNRIIDWKGHPLSGLGPLQRYDLLSVRRDSLVREFFVYLFKEALICVVEEKKKTLGRLLSSASGAASVLTDASNPGPIISPSKGVLRLKGRIYVRHIKQVTASSTAGEISLTIDMEDERLDSFILIFRDQSTMEAWKSNIQSLVAMFQAQSPRSPPQHEQHELDIEEFGGSAKAARMLSGSTATTGSTTDSLLHGSSRSSSTSHGSTAPRQVQPKLSTLGEEDDLLHDYDSQTGLVAPHMSSGPSNSLPPLPHPPLDLILVISIPPPTAVPSTAALKVRVIKTTLEFTIASMGPKDRLSVVTFEVGIGGAVRRTPFLSVGKPASRQRLMRFVEETGVRREDGMPEDEFVVRGSSDEKIDVVTAVNHGLDVVLQRKARNSISGLILVSDASDSTRRAQMDLVLARAEAANVPIHSFGYGRSHDPASLWLMSNHTSGTYTFVKDWYDLRDCVAGCVGGMMSMGLIHMKLHMKIVDGHRFKIRKVSGGPSSILASDGQNVDVDVGELRYGERKEILVELELDNEPPKIMATSGSHSRAMNATDQFVQSMGLDSMSLGDAPDIMDGVMDRMIDELPVFEVDGSFFDPAASKHVSRLAHPVLLTVTLLPTSNASHRSPNSGSDPVIVRRRMELLASDMITRALVLVSRRNFAQAQKILNETKRILHTVLSAISRSLPPPNANGSTVRNRKEVLTLGAVRAMQGILQDLIVLSEALEENVDLFAHDQRNFGAQQAMILRDQKSWTGRSATERLFWTIDHSIELVSRSTDWVARD